MVRAGIFNRLRAQVAVVASCKFVCRSRETRLAFIYNRHVHEISILPQEPMITGTSNFSVAHEVCVSILEEK